MSAKLLLETVKLLDPMSKVINGYVVSREYVTEPQSMFAETVHSVICCCVCVGKKLT